MQVTIDLEHDQIDKIITQELLWHYDNVEEKDYKKALKKVLDYWGVKVK